MGYRHSHALLINILYDRAQQMRPDDEVIALARYATTRLLKTMFNPRAAVADVSEVSLGF